MEKASDLIAALPNHPPNYRPSGSIGVKFALDTGRFLKDAFLTLVRSEATKSGADPRRATKACASGLDSSLLSIYSFRGEGQDQTRRLSGWPETRALGNDHGRKSSHYGRFRWNRP